jgi:hypothetical protein
LTVADSAQPIKGDTTSESFPASYTSMMLQLYLEAIVEQDRELQLLDVGPVCGENIMFFARQAKRLYVCDMFIRLDRNRRKGKAADRIYDELDYPAQSFHGIHLWDLFDHLEDRDADSLVERCHMMLKPQGMMLVIAFEEPFGPSPINSFVIQDGLKITLRPQPHLDLPWRYRSNRELTLLLETFPKVKSFLYRNRVREFLFQRA